MYVYIYAYPPLYPGSCYPMGGITSSSEMPPSVCHFCKYVDLSIYAYTHIYLCMYIYMHAPPVSRLVLPHGWHHLFLRDASFSVPLL